MTQQPLTLCDAFSQLDEAADGASIDPGLSLILNADVVEWVCAALLSGNVRLVHFGWLLLTLLEPWVDL